MTLKLDSVYIRGSDGEFHLHAKARQEKKSVTHYDLLIRKTPEELAEWIETIAQCSRCPHWTTNNGRISESCIGERVISRGSCRLKWLDWLNAEANEM